jgi:hypothetical protein
MASARYDSQQLQKSTPKAAKSHTNGTIEMPQKQPLEPVYQFQPGEQIVVNNHIGMWPGIVSCNLFAVNFLLFDITLSSSHMSRIRYAIHSFRANHKKRFVL